MITKVWFGCVLSAGYALGHHFGWPEALLTSAATVGALLLGVAALVLPQWTTEHERYGVGIPVVDIAMRVVVWLGLATCVVSLLIAVPAAGAAGGALWLSTAVRTFGPGLRARVEQRRSR
ncbi:hypothetical protein GCM10007977_025350 [Dactylosporangium sucinum]|uniref:Uncharacterized protein n=1 Tax=Dactylosporangium sucinum TaxID=1424081 RepID=A0A917TGW6_9ACTN|nr:hypothetical protein GCM10007977_025350 [Dactylosporangium sucinum]